MFVRIFEQGIGTVIEAPDDSIVRPGRLTGLPDILEVRVRVPSGRDSVLLTESVAVVAARLGLYGLKIVGRVACPHRLAGLPNERPRRR